MMWVLPEAAAACPVWLLAAAAADCATLGPMCGPWPVQNVVRLRITDRMAIMHDVCGVETPRP